MRATWTTTLSRLLVLGAFACGNPRPATTSSSAGAGCTSCHGDSTRSASPTSPLYAAPPRGTQGETAVSDRAVGAHQAHLLGKSWSRGIACAECHPVPSSAGHQNGQRDVRFGPLATTGGAGPSWNGTSCAASYCHGNFKNGNVSNAPVWTGANQAACGSCHGTPPGGTHPANSACGTCHAGYTATTVNLDLHLNGVVDTAGGLSCTSCHGQAGRPATAANPQLAAAPPVGTHGESLPSQRAVGAHLAHLQDGTLRPGVACGECHVVPSSTSHSNGAVEMSWGPLSRTGGVTPNWNGTTCAASYCHGNFKNGNTTYAPNWTAPAANMCGTCHGLPPGGTHPAGSDCGSCHTGYTISTVNLATHLDGKVDVANLTCTSCHGNSTQTATPASPLYAAPPVGTKGETATTTRAVGAHQKHLVAGPLTGGVACGECHTVPASVAHSNGTVEITWGPLAKTGSVAPAWNGTSCSASYCHGNFKNGNTTYAPNWTAPAASACGTCHGLPPGGTHPASSDCGSCHTGYTVSTVNLAVHADGKVDVANLTCTSCHGDSTKTATQASPLYAAPPVGTKGETATTTRAVGAHQKHLVAGPLTSGIACTECHVVPASTTHSNGLVDVAWGPLARTGNVAPAWNGTSCSASYCHGNFKNGNTTYAPNWTAPAATACGTCHGLPPGGTHPANSACGSCHTGYTISTVNLAVHADGKVDVANLTCTSCHGDSTKTATPASPLYAAPPVGTKGETATTTRAVGAHQRHLVAGTLTNGVACTECHVVPASTTHSTGVVDVSWGTLARTGGVTPSWSGTTCSASYCHGNFKNGNTSYAPNWTAPAATACGTCHGLPPGGTHPASTACGSCHTGYTISTVVTATHADGKVDVANLTCTSCHGDSTKTATQASPLYAAPPVGTKGETATTTRAVGAHQRHLVASSLTSGVACTECHVVPSSTTHSTGVVELSWGTLARTGNVAPAWNGTSCSASYCHGNFAGGNTSYAPNWTAPAANSCGTCHPTAPTTGEHSRSEHRNAGCGACHSGYTASTINVSIHLNGVKNVGGAGTGIKTWVSPSCTPTDTNSCHGSKTW